MGKTFHLSRSDGSSKLVHHWEIVRASGLLSVINGSIHMSYVQGVMLCFPRSPGTETRGAGTGLQQVSGQAAQHNIG